MAEENKIKKTLELWFSKKNIPMKVVEDTNKIKIDALMAFKAAEPGTIELKCEDVKTAEGLMLTIEPAVEKGAACVSIVDGVAEPIPPGEYTLEDGRKITVIEAGIIDSVADKPADTPADEPKVEEVELKETNAKVTRLIEQVSKITEFSEQQTSRIVALEKENADLKKRTNELIDGLTKFKEDTNEMLTEVFSEASTEPAHKPAEPLKKEEPKKTWRNALN